MLNCGLVVSEFELQSRYEILFRINSFGKGIGSPATIYMIAPSSQIIAVS